MSEQNAVHNELSLAQENAALRSRVSVLEEELALVQEQLAWLKKQVFGRKTEQSSVIMDNGQQLTLFPEEQEQSVKPAEETITVPEHKRKKKRTHDDWMSKLPVEEIEHKEEHPVCEICGAEMKEIGKEKAYDELVFTPAKYHIRRHIVYTYKCPECGEYPSDHDNESDDIERCNIRRAYYPKPMIPGSFCSPELMAHIVYEKYAKAVPLHRQEKDLASKHIPLLKATMSNWILTAAEKWCLPVVEKMHELLLTSSVIHADETPVQVLHEEGRKATTESKMWVYCNGKMNDRSIVIFDYKPTRKGANAQEFLQGFHGYLVRDGFSGYHKVTGVKHVACMIHVRRAFVNAMPSEMCMPPQEPHLHGDSTALLPDKNRTPTKCDNLGRMSNIMLVQSVRIYSTVHLTASLYERGSPAAQAGSHEGCCLATSLPHSYSLSSGFCGIKAHSHPQQCRLHPNEVRFYTGKGAVEVPAKRGSESVQMRFCFRHIQ